MYNQLWPRIDVVLANNVQSISVEAGSRLRGGVWGGAEPPQVGSDIPTEKVSTQALPEI